MKSTASHSTLAWLRCVVLGIVLALPTTARSAALGPGFDLCSTPGLLTWDVKAEGAGLFDPPIVFGEPTSGPGNTNLIIQRLGGLAEGQTGQIPVEMVALSLVSVDPVDISGVLYNVFVGLDPAQPSVGWDDITSHDPGGGTFDTFIDGFFKVDLVEVGNPARVLTELQHHTMSATGSLWSPYGWGGYPADASYPSGGFYVDTTGITFDTGPIPLAYPASTVPESTGLALVGTAAVGLLGVRRRRTIA